MRHAPAPIINFMINRRADLCGSKYRLNFRPLRFNLGIFAPTPHPSKINLNVLRAVIGYYLLTLAGMRLRCCLGLVCPPSAHLPYALPPPPLSPASAPPPYSRISGRAGFRWSPLRRFRCCGGGRAVLSPACYGVRASAKSTHARPFSSVGVFAED